MNACTYATDSSRGCTASVCSATGWDDSACTTCTDECIPGSRQCIGTTGYRVCGNYDADSCVEWSTTNNCQAGTACTNGYCIVITCVDADDDGYYNATGCGTLVDCDDQDPNVNPGMMELCMNGIDDDCDGLVDENDPDCAASVCGNGVTEPGEQCDLGLSNGACPAVCSATCELNNCVDPECGDAIIQPGEECDLNNWGPIVGCTDFDTYTGGPLSCGSDCYFNTSLCIGTPGGYCGDAIIQRGETCDLNNWGPILGCEDFDSFTGGFLSCGLNCHFNTTLCTGDCTDADDDGYAIEGGACGLIDCNDLNPNINPGVPENCTNGLDDDCDGLIDSFDPDCPLIQCINDTDCPPIDCPSINGTVNGTCFAGTCYYEEPPFTCITECSDTIDNDGDTFIDYPADPGCANFSDDDESESCLNDSECVSVCPDGWPLPGRCIAGECDFTNTTVCDLCHPFYAPFDYDDNGLLNMADASILTTVIFGAPCPALHVCDVNGDAVVDGADLVRLIAIVDGLYNNGEQCTDGLDNNCDGMTDVEDPVCNLAFCGDSIIQPGEQCDSSNWGPITGCADFNHFTGGTLSCDPISCFFNTSLCDVPEPVCGDGIIQPGEECDGANWGPIDACTDLDSFGGGSLSCGADCYFNTSLCTGTPGVCGDAVINPGEDCDGDSWGPIVDCTDLDSFTGGTLTCGPACHFNTTFCLMPEPFCGDRTIDAGEQCDLDNWGPVTSCLDFDSFLGGALSCDGCQFNTSLCSLTPTEICGNGIVEAMEQCDQGVNNGACPSLCSATCELNDCPEPLCGDTVIQPGEQCDGSNWGAITGCGDFDSFTGGTLSCNAISCLFDTSLCNGTIGVCGDGTINVGEECDGAAWGPITGCQNFDSFLGGSLSCAPTCTFNTSLCTLIPAQVCGNGVVEVGEACDLGPANGVCPSGCSDLCALNNCTLPVCGDSIIQPGEQCDSSNWGPITGCLDFNFTNGTLSCDPVSCLFNITNCTGGLPGVCGDAVINAGEQCDSSNWGNITGCVDFDSFIGGALSCSDCFFNTSLCFGNLTCTDVDGDGYSPVGGACGLIDCNDTVITIHPGAPENCTNGLDDDCDGLIDANDPECYAFPLCGDNVIQAGEECDGNNWGGITNCSAFDTYTGGTLSCGATCHFNTSLCTGIVGGVCGDGIIQQGENCDLNNWGPIMNCSAFDSFTGGTLSCANTCLFNTSLCTGGSANSVCGNGVIEFGEACDLSNFGGLSCSSYGYNNGALSCSATCAIVTGGCYNGGGGGGGGTGGKINVTPSCVGDECVAFLSYNSRVSMPLLSIVQYQVTVLNNGPEVRDAVLSLDLPSNWQYDGVKELGTLKRGETRRVTFRILVSEDLEPTQEFTVMLKDNNHVITSGEVGVRVVIPDFAVRIKPSLNDYAGQPDAEVYVIVNNRGSDPMKDLEVELDINEGRRTDYVQYLGVFTAKPYSKFRYRYTYPVARLGDGIAAVAVLTEGGEIIANSDDSLESVYHPTPYEKDARRQATIKVYD